MKLPEANGSARRRRIAQWGASACRMSIICGAFMVSGGHAVAQNAQGDDQGAADVVHLEEIVVTARQKVEALTEVPAAITSYSSDFLEKQNITSFVDYASKVPNLSFQFGQGGTFLWSGDRETSIRGVVGTGTTAFYIDDTPVPSSVSPQVLNLDRIEVLKGPQGTLFGASSMGGNLRYITKKPSFKDNEGTLSVQAGGTKNGGFDYDANIQNNMVLVQDKLALNVALGYRQDSGFITRQFPGATGSLVVKEGEGRNRILSGSAALRAQLTDSLEATTSFIGQSSRLHGFPGAYLPLPGYRPLSYTLNRDTDVQEYSKDNWGLGALVLRYKGEGFNVVSSTSYFSRKITQLDDNTEGTKFFFRDAIDPGTGNPIFGIDFSGVPFYVVIESRENAFTHETRLSFDQGTLIPGLSGIVGVFHKHKRNKNFNPGVVVPELGAAGFLPPYLAEVRTKESEKNTAIFGELYYEPLPKLTFTLGLRQYWIDQHQDPSTDTGALFAGGSNFNAARDNKESGLVPKGVISYEIGDRGNVYASVSKGFRVGGANGSLPSFCDADLAAIGLTRSGAGKFRSDTLWSYEVGAKSRMAGGRLTATAAGFRMDWSNIQQTGLLPLCGITFVGNAGKARINGGELEIGGRPLANVPLTLQLGVGYLDAKLIDPGLLLQQQGPNSRLGLVPKWTASISGYYETPIRDNMDFFIAADYSYTSSTVVWSAPATRQPLNMVNGNFGVRFGRSELMIYGKNLFDKRLTYGDQPISGFERRDPNASGGFDRVLRGVVSRPRQIGVQYQLSF